MTCRSYDHYFNLLVHGYCWECKHVFALGTQEEVDQRIAEMHRDPAFRIIKEPNL